MNHQFKGAIPYHLDLLAASTSFLNCLPSSLKALSKGKPGRQPVLVGKSRPELLRNWITQSGRFLLLGRIRDKPHQTRYTSSIPYQRFLFPGLRISHFLLRWIKPRWNSKSALILLHSKRGQNQSGRESLESGGDEMVPPRKAPQKRRSKPREEASSYPSWLASSLQWDCSVFELGKRSKRRGRFWRWESQSSLAVWGPE